MALLWGEKLLYRRPNTFRWDEHLAQSQDTWSIGEHQRIINRKEAFNISPIRKGEITLFKDSTLISQT
jgi:hypothetical protein